MNEDISRDEPGRGRRPWYRWHWTTYLVLLVPLGFWTLLAVPGYTVSGVSSKESSGAGFGLCPVAELQEHGWPLVHLDRLGEGALTPLGPEDVLDPIRASFRQQCRALGWFRWADIESAYPWDLAEARRANPHVYELVSSYVEPGWQRLSHWSQRGLYGEAVFLPAALAINLLVAALLCAAIVAPYEWWCRHRWHYSLRMLLGLFVVAALVFGYARWLVDRRTSEAEIERQLYDAGADCAREYVGPGWLWRLLAESRGDALPGDPFNPLKSGRLSILCPIREVNGGIGIPSDVGVPRPLAQVRQLLT